MLGWCLACCERNNSSNSENESYPNHQTQRKASTSTRQVPPQIRRALPVLERWLETNDDTVLEELVPEGSKEKESFVEQQLRHYQSLTRRQPRDFLDSRKLIQWGGSGGAHENPSDLQAFVFVKRTWLLEMGPTFLARQKSLPCCQELRQRHDSGEIFASLSQVYPTTAEEDVPLLSSHTPKAAFCSHRWIDPSHPDPEGLHLSLILKSLQQAPQIEYVWYDYWCLPQKLQGGQEPRSPEDQALFSLCLRNLRQFQVRVPLYFLPLWANQDDYFNRGWCFAEALWGMESTVMFPDVNGLSRNQEAHFLQERCLFLMVMIAEGAESARQLLSTIFRETKQMTESKNGKEATQLLDQLLDFEPTEYCKVMAVMTRGNVSISLPNKPAALEMFEQVEIMARELGERELEARGQLGKAIALGHPSDKAHWSSRALETLLEADNPMPYEVIRMASIIAKLRQDFKIQELFTLWRISIDTLSVLVGVRLERLAFLWQSSAEDLEEESKVLAEWMAPGPFAPPHDLALKQYAVMDLIDTFSKVNEYVFDQNDGKIDARMIESFGALLLVMSESIPDGETKAIFLWNIGTLYQSIDDFQQSIAVYERAIQMTLHEKAKILQNLSNSLRLAGEYEASWTRCVEAIELKLERKSIEHISPSFHGLCIAGIELNVDNAQLLEVAKISYALYTRFYGEGNHRTLAGKELLQLIRMFVLE